MLKKINTVRYVATENPHKFKVLTNAILGKRSSLEIAGTISTVLDPEVLLPHCLRESPSRVVDNNYYIGWKLIQCNKYQALLKMPDTIGPDYVVCPWEDVMALMTKGPLETQELRWIVNDGYTRLISRVDEESEELKPFILGDNYLRADSLRLEHVGLFIKRSLGDELIYGIVGEQVVRNGGLHDGGTRPTVICSQSNHYNISTEMEVQDAPPLTVRGVQQFTAWLKSSEAQPSYLKSVPWSVAKTECELLSREALEFVQLSHPVMLMFTARELEEGPFLRKYSADFPDLFATTLTVPKGNSEVSLSLLNSDSRSHFLCAKISATKTGWKLEFLITSAGLPIRAYRLKTFQEVYDLLDKIVEINSLCTVLCKDPSAECYTLPLARQYAYQFLNLLKFT